MTGLALLALAVSVAGVARPARAEILYTLKDLGPVSVRGVNASGQVVGSADIAGGAPHASLYGGGQPGRADLGHPASRDVVGRPSEMGLGFLSPARRAGSNPEGSPWQTRGY
jgi:probable HAF family extracellular repeat protein